MKSKNLISEGLLVVKRVNYETDKRYHAEKTKASIPVTMEQILKLYKGIDGESWLLDSPKDFISIEGGLAPVEHYQKVVDYYRKVEKTGFYDLIYLANAESELPLKLKSEGWFFYGYDYGMYLGEYNSWSVVFQEILYGTLPEMRAFANKLNNNLLFDKLEDALELGAIRDKISKSEFAAFLETIDEGEDFGPIAVYGIDI